MIRMTRLAATLAFGAGLTAAGVALAQTQTAPAASTQPAPPPAQSPPPSAQSETPTTDASGPDFSQPTYSVNPPPDGSSGVYLPAVIGGYAKSVVGCVVVGCDDGPQVGGASAPASPATAPPPATAPVDPH